MHVLILELFLVVHFFGTQLQNLIWGKLSGLLFLDRRVFI